jgi:hypothetical protein
VVSIPRAEEKLNLFHCFFLQGEPAAGEAQTSSDRDVKNEDSAVEPQVGFSHDGMGES